MVIIGGESPGGQGKPRVLEVSVLDDGRVSLWIYNPPRDDIQKGWEIVVTREDLLNGLEQAGIPGN